MTVVELGRHRVDDASNIIRARTFQTPQVKESTQ
jgi:hypothetical protein